MTALLDFPAQFAVQLDGLPAHVFQPPDQQLIVQTLGQAGRNHSVHLPGDHTQREQHDRRQHTPSLQLGLTAAQQHNRCGKQPWDGKRAERPERHTAGHAPGKEHRGKRAEQYRLL